MLPIFLALLVTASAQTPLDIDPDVLDSIWITEKRTTEATITERTTQRLEDIIVSPTQTSVFKDKNNETCQCVPYYMCRGGKVNDKDLKDYTGWNELNVRFDSNECQESVEVCCPAPQKLEDAPQREPLKMKGCGYRNVKGVGVTITGGSGKEAQFGEFPWVVALIDVMNESYIGVGVIIHPEVVMTTAHIASKYGPGKFKVRAGEWDTQTIKEELQYQERDVREIYLHEDFNTASKLANDVALLRLAQPLLLAEHINTLCLPEQDEVFDSAKKCVANGWGKDVFGLQGRYAVILKRVELDMVPYGRCNTLLRQTRLGSRYRLHESFVCAGGEAGQDTCQGDGGAPLACPIGDDRYKLTGLVAGGIGCGEPNVPAIYAAVPAFRLWVDAKMNQWGYDTASYKI